MRMTFSPHTGQRNPHFLKKIRENIVDLKALLLPSDYLADIGCCQGHLYAHLKHERYIGIDLFAANVAEARRLHPKVTFECADLFTLAGKWDVVFCCRVLMHFDAMIDQAIQRLISYARKWCVLVIPIGEESCAIETIKGDAVYFRTFDERTIKSAGECKIIQHEPYCTVIFKCE